MRLPRIFIFLAVGLLEACSPDPQPEKAFPRQPLLEAQETRIEAKNFYCARVRESFLATITVFSAPVISGITPGAAKECLGQISRNTPFRPVVQRRYGVEGYYVGRSKNGHLWCSSALPVDGPSSFTLKVPEGIPFNQEEIDECFKNVTPVFSPRPTSGKDA